MAGSTTETVERAALRLLRACAQADPAEGAALQLAVDQVRLVALAHGMDPLPDYMRHPEIGGYRPKPSEDRARRMRILVFGRDSFTCRRCGWQPDPKPGADYDGRYVPGGFRGWSARPRWRHLALDHVVPWCCGGLFEAANLQTLCTSCNSSKGAKF